MEVFRMMKIIVFNRNGDASARLDLSLLWLDMDWNYMLPNSCQALIILLNHTK